MLKQEILDHDNLKAFKQHGFLPVNSSGENQAVGNCIFCGKDNHFYINVETKQWDCKVCGIKGGYSTFINEILELCKEQFTVKESLKLARKRGLKARTLLSHNVGYNPYINSYVIPLYKMNDSNIVYSLKIFPILKNGELSKLRMNTYGMKSGMMGWYNLDDPSIDTWWIVEGEWDYFTLYEILTNLNINDGILGLSLATGFKDEFMNYFKNKTVHVLLDNDPDIINKQTKKKQFGAGIQGMIKIYNKISSLTKSIDFIHWPQDYKDGYDVNDCYKDNKSNAQKTFDQICGFLNQYPPKMDLKNIVDNKNTDNKSKQSKRYSGKGIDCREVYKVFNKWLKLKSNNLVDVTLGCIIGNRFPGDSIWLQLVGPSGSAKSVMCMALDCHFDVEVADTLTPATLISGSTTAGGGDPSLLPKLNKRHLVIKDFTTILEMQPAYRNEIFGIFRSVYDGYYSKHFGSGTFTRSGKSKFGFITGVTPAIELYTEGFTALGERFVRFNLDIADVHDILKQIDNNIELEFEENIQMQTELKEVIKEVLDYDYDIKSVKLDDDVLKTIRYLSICIEMVRGTVPFERFTKEITHKAITALPTRSYIQMRKLLMGLLLFKNIKEPSIECLSLIRHVARSTIHISREDILYRLYKNHRKKELLNLSDLHKLLKLPTVTCQRTLEKLVALGVVNEVKGVSSLKPKYKLTDQIIEAIEKGGLYR